MKRFSRAGDKPPKSAYGRATPRETAKDRFSSQVIDKSQLLGDVLENNKHIKWLVGEVGLEPTKA
jgi:hypothetical protein